jgi:hypothetical protein
LKRRDFLKAGAVTLAVATIVPVVAAEKPWQEMTVEELTRHMLQKRQAQVAPNFMQLHRCSKCSIFYLCPDRYVLPSCCVSTVEIRCSPCSMNVDKYGPQGFRELWTEAHGITEGKAA